MPFPMASRAPSVTTDTADTANPMQIMRSVPAACDNRFCIIAEQMNQLIRNGQT